MTLSYINLTLDIASYTSEYGKEHPIAGKVITSSMSRSLGFSDINRIKVRAPTRDFYDEPTEDGPEPPFPFIDKGTASVVASDVWSSVSFLI